jgi:hypothetical protein
MMSDLAKELADLELRLTIIEKKTEMLSMILQDENPLLMVFMGGVTAFFAPERTTVSAKIAVAKSQIEELEKPNPKLN